MRDGKWVWLGYTDKEDEGKFISYKNRKPLVLDGMKWSIGEPNNNGNQDCVTYSSELGTLGDSSCTLKCHAACKVTGFVSFTLDGVCEESAVDSHYVLQPNGVMLGYLRTVMIWNETTRQWEIWNKEKRTLVATMDKTIGFPLGTFPWHILDVNCTDDDASTRRLNLHLQVDRPGKYCCGDGVCLDSEIVCDGNRNCEDGSDENKCALIQTNPLYNEVRPPQKIDENKVIIPKSSFQNIYIYLVYYQMKCFTDV